MHFRTIGSLYLIGVIVIGMAAGVNPPRTERKDSSYQLRKVQEWRAAAVQHNLGEADSAAAEIGDWDQDDLELVIEFVTKLASQSGKKLRKTLARASLRRILQLTDQEVRNGDLNRILKQGALLHTDIALLGLQTKGAANPSEPLAVSIDGRVAGLLKTLHWEFARQLIDSISLSPNGDAAVRQWYIATTAHMQSRGLLAYADRNLEKALHVFPSDDRLLFYAGVLHETWAAPANQNLSLPEGARVTYGSMKEELKRARKFYEKSIEANPDSAETHLRLGRVLGLLGNHPQAAAELEQAAASIKDSQLLYYTSLFLGYEYSMLYRRSEAREQYERAAELYPNAQSPLFALSQLARSSANVEGALLLLQRVFVLPHTESWEADPWWTYYLAPVRDADTLITEMRKEFRNLSR